jgi:hypothetical protein
MRWPRLAWGLAAGLAMIRPAMAAEDKAGMEFFEGKIRPILVDHCYPCHSHESGKAKGGLLLDNRDALLKGGDNGPVIKPGDANASLLIRAVRYTNDDLQMPPKNKKLAATQIAALETWINMGAPDPRTAASGVPKVEAIREQARTHWAFQPVREPAIPTVKNKHFTRTPVDRFVVARLEKAGLEPSPLADRRTLIRRATFDLTGLPPTPEEVRAFVADRSPDAFAKVIDRLLASPLYGERWGRHWLDVARYADTKGYVFEEDRHYPYAYTYRDYVIRSFNEDLPYDQFLKQQIAADLLPGGDPRSLAALGYLTVGRRFINNIHDIIDDRIDVVCRGMMGLTVNCARCHDHKFDPIPTRDYYSLYGVFASSTEPEQEPLLGTDVPGKAGADYMAEHKKRLAEREDYIHTQETAMAAQLRHQSGQYLLAAFEAQRPGNKIDADNIAQTNKLDPGVLHRWMDGLDKWHKESSPIFAPWFAFANLPADGFAEQGKRVATNAAANANALVARAFAGEAPHSMKDVAERYGSLLKEIDEQWEKLVAKTPGATALPDASAEALRQVLYAADAPANLPHAEFDRLYETSVSQKIRALQRSIDEWDATSPGAPPRAMALRDTADPHDVSVFIRGNSGNAGPVAPRQFLEVLAGPNRKPFHKGSGRLELAEAVASRDNPLTARVLVNRVWLYHFGAPLVATPSDFGLRSDPPTHPELLDYLAARFMADGWSLKKLHRLIMLSGVYMQASDDNPAAEKIDPGNQLLWRMNRQRLDFEAMRDTLLAVSGDLDLTRGGHGVDVTDPAVKRRTVYMTVDRQNLPDLFRTFDLASPDNTSPRRFHTTVPQQALFMMNSPFIVAQAKHLVEMPQFKSESSERKRVKLLYQLAYQRDPSKEEIKWALEFLRTPSEPPRAPMTNWAFGYGRYDEKEARVAVFNKFPYFNGTVFQGGATLPDAKLGWAMLTASGGHPGDDPQHAAIRRWVAPRAGTVSIEASLVHGSDQGDGVRGRIVSSRLGLLGQWLAHNKTEATPLERVDVRAGDTIDFVTDCYGTVYFDSFGWAPTIRFHADGSTIPGQRMKWSAKDDFEDAAHTAQPELDAWQKYAQVILMSNELVFVD